jgi:hypothetical protein
MRAILLLLLVAQISFAPVGNRPNTEFVHAVEFAYYLYPRQLWERELVWLKTIGVRTIAFSIPWNWHEVQRGSVDFEGRTSPRRDLIGLVRILRKLGLQGWIRPMPPAGEWRNGGMPAWALRDTATAAEWRESLRKAMAHQTSAHGGPIAFAEIGPVLDAPSPPAPVTIVSSVEPGASLQFRHALASGAGSLLWTRLEDQLIPPGWGGPGAPLIRHGAISLAGEERPAAATVRRAAALLRHWEEVLPEMTARSTPSVRTILGKPARDIDAVQLIAPAQGGISAVSVINRGTKIFRGELRVAEPGSKRRLQVSEVDLPPGETIWLPLHVPLSRGSLCQNCSAFANGDEIVYATAELETVEFENGILAMEFAAPRKGEALVRLSRRPSGPYLAAGRPADFGWDERSMIARLAIPEGKGPGARVRVGLAIEPPDSSAFFVDTTRLVIGRPNRVKTSYSSEELAARSRLRLPENYATRVVGRSPLEIEYEIDVPPETLHGEWLNAAIKADGVLLGRARLQQLRPASVRLADMIVMHFGSQELAVYPPLVPVDARAGRNIGAIVRNNYPQIQNFQLAAEGERFQFSPAKADVTVGPSTERSLSLRVFAEGLEPGLYDWRLRLAGAADVVLPARFAAIPRGEAIAYTLDVDEDGGGEFVLENQKLRAVFSAEDGGRWLDFVWKETGLNLLPEAGALTGSGQVQVESSREGRDAVLKFSSRDWTRTIRLPGDGNNLIVEQDRPLPPETLSNERKSGVAFTVTRETPARAVYTADRAP